MPAGARPQGSCSPMVLQRYINQVEGLGKYVQVPQIPSDPYDIQAGLAKKMLAAYDTKLSATQQAADKVIRHRRLYAGALK